jgi:uncharacterized protein (TIGR04255 family)
MPFALPEPITDALGNSPLKLVVCQVRIEESPSIADPRVGLEVFERLGGRSGRYPVFEPFKGEQVAIRLGPNVPMSTQQTSLSGWRALSDDRSWVVAMLPGSVALETKTYTTWDEDFLPRMEAVLDAVGQTLRPAIQMRLGLRYVDLITRQPIESPHGWHGWISDELLGPILHPTIGPGVISTQQQVDIDAGSGIRCTLRHGAVPVDADGGLGYLLDWDVYQEEVRAFDALAIREWLVGSHRLVLQLFQQAITPQLLDELRR